MTNDMSMTKANCNKNTALYRLYRRRDRWLGRTRSTSYVCFVCVRPCTAGEARGTQACAGAPAAPGRGCGAAAPRTPPYIPNNTYYIYTTHIRTY